MNFHFSGPHLEIFQLPTNFGRKLGSFGVVSKVLYSHHLEKLPRSFLQQFMGTHDH